MRLIRIIVSLLNPTPADRLAKLRKVRKTRRSKYTRAEPSAKKEKKKVRWGRRPRR